jgi:hypothetical protein
MDGPKIIFDKSFLHRLKAEYLFELDIFFDIMPTPILKREILADLSKPESSKTDWESVVKSLCRKMAVSGMDLIHYRKASIYELMYGQEIPMDGAKYFIDADASHVTMHGRGIHVDGRLLQRDWRRWAEGAFTDEERRQGEAFRNEIKELDLSGVQMLRKSMGQRFADFRTSEAVIRAVRHIVDDPAADNQHFLFLITASSLQIPEADFPKITSRLKKLGAKTLREGAPFATSVTEIFFAWIALMARGLHGQRNSDICDIEYLYYAPFCKVFTSCDRLQKTLWPATSSKAIWCDGDELLDDLANRAELRKSDPDRVKGPHPIPLEGSVITRIFEELRPRR